MRVFLALFALVSLLGAHDLVHRVFHSECIAVSFAYADQSDFSYQAYELYAPGETIPYQVGRTDKSSSLCFRPTKQGVWTLKAFGEDGHGAAVEITVDEHLALSGYAQPLYEKFQKIFVGLALIFALFCTLYLYKKRRSK
ncbi:hypothetical protein LOH54_07040 [Sulfurimonas sp. HSL-3221]|uniref:hypothetical protein n=1 Tax=Sulfurimonadaceae TaxID=2771471 RepID=UPI001E55FBF0|nr:hypothetical protein [Sulfurimonas sp. HSL-3221]UFS61415.1 hypothetical protein LOH54_07040 [Sulfurimonas sp. HSL-3221]